jgi:hypothetical protein
MEIYFELSAQLLFLHYQSFSFHPILIKAAQKIPNLLLTDLAE